MRYTITWYNAAWRVCNETIISCHPQADVSRNCHINLNLWYNGIKNLKLPWFLADFLCSMIFLERDFLRYCWCNLSHLQRDTCAVKVNRNNQIDSSETALDFPKVSWSVTWFFLLFFVQAKTTGNLDNFEANTWDIIDGVHDDRKQQSRLPRSDQWNSNNHRVTPK